MTETPRPTQYQVRLVDGWAVEWTPYTAIDMCSAAEIAVYDAWEGGSTDEVRNGAEVPVHVKGDDGVIWTVFVEVVFEPTCRARQPVRAVQVVSDQGMETLKYEVPKGEDPAISYDRACRVATEYARDNFRLREENRTLRQWQARALRAFELVCSVYTENEGWAEVSRLEAEAVTLPPPS